jgi:hypothetical protein
VSEGPLLDREGIHGALTRLGERLARRGVTADVYLFGGAAMALARDEREQRGDERPIGPRQANAARLLTLQYSRLMPQQQDLRVLPRVRTDGEEHPRREPEGG